MPNELGEQLAPANAATFNGITLIARKLAPALKQRAAPSFDCVSSPINEFRPYRSRN